MIPTVTFYQEKNKKPVFVNFQLNGKQIRFSTSISVPCQYWDKKKDLPYINYLKYIDVRDKLDAIKMIIIEMVVASKKKDEIKGAVIRKAQGIESKQMNVLDYARILKIEKVNKDIEPRHIKNAIAFLQKYEKDTNTILEFNDIDYNFKESFHQWILRQRYMKHNKEKRYSTNYIRRVMTSVREIKLQAIKRGLSDDYNFKNTTWTLKTFKPDQFVLTWDTLFDLFKLDLKSIEENRTAQEIDQDRADGVKYDVLENDRIVFLISCFMGCRVSDTQRLNEAKQVKYKGVDYLEFHTQKTDTLVAIPLLPQLKMIKTNLKDNFPKPSSDFNSNLKHIFKHIIPEEITIRRGIGNKIVREKIEAFKLVASHTARRTFATLFVQMGVPLAYVSQILGHESISQTEEYIQLEILMKQQSSEEILRILHSSITLFKADGV